MSKGHLSRKRVQLQKGNGEVVGQQEEQTVTVDDCCLPVASELEAYSKINPDIILFLMEISKKEQEHRHKIENKQAEIVEVNNNYSYNVNRRGMLYAFLIIVLSLFFSGFLIYFEKNIAGSIFGGVTLATTIAIFMPRRRRSNVEDSDN
ncbi:MAG: DUF2335 domain-containing protein [Rikenellaceae bacterium]